MSLAENANPCQCYSPRMPTVANVNCRGCQPLPISCRLATRHCRDAKDDSPRMGYFQHSHFSSRRPLDLLRQNLHLCSHLRVFRSRFPCPFLLSAFSDVPIPVLLSIHPRPYLPLDNIPIAMFHLPHNS